MNYPNQQYGGQQYPQQQPPMGYAPAQGGYPPQGWNTGQPPAPSGGAFQGAPAADFFKSADWEGQLCIFEPLGFKAQVSTVNGPSDAVESNVTVLLPDGNVREFKGTTIFGSAIVPSLRQAIGGLPVLGRITQGVAKPGQSAPWLIGPFSPEDAARAEAFLASRPKLQGGQPQQQPQNVPPAAPYGQQAPQQGYGAPQGQYPPQGAPQAPYGQPQQQQGWNQPPTGYGTPDQAPQGYGQPGQYPAAPNQYGGPAGPVPGAPNAPYPANVHQGQPPTSVAAQGGYQVPQAGPDGAPPAEWNVAGVPPEVAAQIARQQGYAGPQA